MVRIGKRDLEGRHPRRRPRFADHLGRPDFRRDLPRSKRAALPSLPGSQVGPTTVDEGGAAIAVVAARVKPRPSTRKQYSI